MAQMTKMHVTPKPIRSPVSCGRMNVVMETMVVTPVGKMTFTT
eukprot:CAMPEP_0180823762 /NCGR_PEP_ID=MMETSP1038_2-20121128/72077_1 /TAXON_ID=632150 /ORGANISM="Azadinium spinosum, Strain 3D9" /LENGTH=42 /DNA_ID= /DNA_START= /DNA_END= /DNA_ORIENTATION=